ncbi:uncharacterized protein B0T15DRAFT_488664 [Chaetomium strumarium]|uniref:Transmembrane protein n=1 Tax=Chaetomium strumarium TaxID=1170767 RepID=A0AAJ0H193_9PEZI|nr:hypothetical protein B0T15DRAFT_488664 [Chaetomium strumarium]
MSNNDNDSSPKPAVSNPPTASPPSTHNHSSPGHIQPQPPPPLPPPPQQVKEGGEEPPHLTSSMSRPNPNKWWPALSFSFSFAPTTTDNVIELLWDVALAFFAVRLALLYAALVAGSSILLLLLLPLHFPAPLPLPVPVTVVLACSAFWARVVVKWCEVPPVAGFRLAVGGAAVVLVLLAEGVGGFVWCEVLRRQGVGMMMMGGWMSLLGALAGFGLMPALLMMVGGGGKGEKGRANAAAAAAGLGEGSWEK